MMETLAALHGILRWPILLVLTAGLMRALVGLRRPETGKLERPDRILGSLLVGGIDTQVVLGLILLFGSDAWAEQQAHIGFMSATLISAHMLFVLAKKQPSRGLLLVLFLLPTVLVILGLRMA